MRTLGRVLVCGGVLGIAMVSGQGVASAQVIPSLDVEIRLDPTAPTTGELVSGLRSVEGIAQALDGIRRVDLYVMPAGLTRDVSSAVPVDSFTSNVPLNKADFDLEWDSATTAARLVDIVVVARTATRTGQIEIPGVRVAEAAAAPSVATERAPAATKAAAPVRAAAPATATVPRRAGTALAAPARTVALVVDTAEVTEAQATSFFSVYGQLPFAAAAAPAARPALVTPASDSTRGAWPYVAAGVVLMVTAGHVQRVVQTSGNRRG